jgi:acyl carrier protein
MTTYKPETLEAVRGAIARVKDADLSAVRAEDQLNLDSVERISLIAELENTFNMELSLDAVTPESFESLSTLAQLIDARQ